MKTVDIMIDELVQEIKKQEEDIAKFEVKLNRARNSGKEWWVVNHLERLIRQRRRDVNQNLLKIGKLMHDKKINKKV